MDFSREIKSLLLDFSSHFGGIKRAVCMAILCPVKRAISWLVLAKLNIKLCCQCLSFPKGAQVCKRLAFIRFLHHQALSNPFQRERLIKLLWQSSSFCDCGIIGVNLVGISHYLLILAAGSVSVVVMVSFQKLVPYFSLSYFI